MYPKLKLCSIPLLDPDLIKPQVVFYRQTIRGLISAAWLCFLIGLIKSPRFKKTPQIGSQSFSTN